MNPTVCIVDCRIHNKLEDDYLTLNVWGKPVFSYIIEECLQSECFIKSYIITDSKYLKSIAQNLFGDQVTVIMPYDNFKSEENKEKDNPRYFIVQGGALMLKKETIRCVLKSGGGIICSVKRLEIPCLYPYDFSKETLEICSDTFILTNISPWHSENKSYLQKETNALITNYLLSSTESLIVCTKNDFELALVLKKKEYNEKILLETIKDRIKEKTEIINYGLEHSVCLVGHSQLDDWEIEHLCGMPVRNCAVRGISSFQYQELILKTELLNCKSDVFVVMHGTNDIVYNYSIDQIVESILESVFYLQKHNPTAILCFVSCLHTNGRADRSNKKIDQLNAALKPVLENCNIWWIDTAKMDDLFGNLKLEYTKDGLHLSKKGYDVFKILIEQEIKKAKGFYNK